MNEMTRKAMMDKLKQEVMRRGMMLMSNPKVMKMMADPRVMNAISQGFAIKGQIQSSIDARIRSVAHSLNLVTRDDLEGLRQTLHRMEDSVSDLERKVESEGQGAQG
jgi:BMFP domain-containing protein YqiC